MLPDKFLDLQFKKNFFKDQYPLSGNCTVVDQQIKSISADIDAIRQREASGKKEGPGLGHLVGKKIRDESKKWLKNLLLEKENAFDKMECRNLFETQRQTETATVFNEKAKNADVSVLSKTKSKQIAFAAIGGVVVLTALYLITRQK